MGGVFEYLSDLWIHFDVHVAPIPQFIVSLLHSLLGPDLEGLSNDSIDRVDDPLHFH